MRKTIDGPIILPIKLTPFQQGVVADKSRIKIVNGGRQVGKTDLSAYWLSERAITVEGNHMYVAKTMGLIKDEFFPRLLKLIPKWMIVSVDKRDHTIVISNGRFTSTILCKSAEKEDNLRGRVVHSLVIDEAAFVSHTLWNYVLQATIAKNKAPVLIISSPRNGWFYRQWLLASEGKLPEWKAFKATIHDNPYIPREEIDRIQKTVSRDVWLQEYMAEPQNHQGVVYQEYSEESIFNPDHKFQEVKNWQAVIGIDYGLADDTAAIWVHISPNGHLVVADAHIQNGWHVSRHASVIQQKNNGLKIPYGNVVLDRSAFKREATSRTSISEQFRENGITCQKSEKDLNVGIDILKRFMHGDGSTPWIHFSTRVPDIVRSIEEWEHGTHEPDCLAALRYAVVHIVKKKLTVLADAIPSTLSDSGEAPTESKPAPGRTKIPGWGESKKRTWDWDYTAGAPL